MCTNFKIYFMRKFIRARFLFASLFFIFNIDSLESLYLPKGPFELPGSQDCTSTFLLADDAFSLSTTIMKPYTGKNLDEKHKICNYRLDKTRKVCWCLVANVLS